MTKTKKKLIQYLKDKLDEQEMYYEDLMEFGYTGDEWTAKKEYDAKDFEEEIKDLRKWIEYLMK